MFSEKTVQKSRRLQVALGVFGVFVVYFLFFRSSSDSLLSSSSSSSLKDSYSNEELNEILKGDTYSDQNEFEIKRVELSNINLVKPFMHPNTLELINFVNKGQVLINQDKIRLVSDKPNQIGSIFSKNPISKSQTSSFELELEFSMNGKAVRNGLYGDGLALWLTENPLNLDGEVFGASNFFKGLGLFIDSYRNSNDKSTRSRAFPYVSLQVNDGKIFYNRDNDGADTELAGCSVDGLYNARGGLSKLRLIYIRETGYLSVDFDIRNTGSWKNCFTIHDSIILPENPYIGLSAQTGELSHNVDIFNIATYGLFDENMNTIKSLEQIGSNLEKLYGKEEETNGQIQGKTDSDDNNIEDEDDTEEQEEDDQSTISRNRRSRRPLENEKKYGRHGNFFGWVWHLIKTFFLIILCLIVLYIISIIVRAQLEKRRLRNKNYYKRGGGALVI
ncbi:hypothetical protein PACTADRAFT_50179 [Pachysolen tannophilus NRRL Y-2460]|uniref:L-type lectin-like domain-containing protein n=1 Tax=Pachysolen tannophilus NRRL Y-2460 TaxID=669874 RepID=A0A1E4TUN5_PACTA|nr:hypothetical protein PACTADRAFT_50179 [Pachysolen tannophilus NRRL Y-2460]